MAAPKAYPGARPYAWALLLEFWLVGGTIAFALKYYQKAYSDVFALPALLEMGKEGHMILIFVGVSTLLGAMSLALSVSNHKRPLNVLACLAYALGNALLGTGPIVLASFDLGRW